MGLKRVGIGAAVLAAAGALALAAHGDPVTSLPFWFVPTNQQPVAGHIFTGLVLDSLSPQFKASCGRATVGGVRAVPQNHVYFNGTQWSTTVCSWRIPKGSAGKMLRVTGAMAGADGGSGPSLSPIHTQSWVVSR